MKRGRVTGLGRVGRVMTVTGNCRGYEYAREVEGQLRLDPLFPVSDDKLECDGTSLFQVTSPTDKILLN